MFSSDNSTFQERFKQKMHLIGKDGIDGILNIRVNPVLKAPKQGGNIWKQNFNDEIKKPEKKHNLLIKSGEEITSSRTKHHYKNYENHMIKKEKPTHQFLNLNRSSTRSSHSQRHNHNINNNFNNHDHHHSKSNNHNQIFHCNNHNKNRLNINNYNNHHNHIPSHNNNHHNYYPNSNIHKHVVHDTYKNNANYNDHHHTRHYNSPNHNVSHSQNNIHYHRNNNLHHHRKKSNERKRNKNFNSYNSETKSHLPYKSPTDFNFSKMQKEKNHYHNQDIVYDNINPKHQTRHFKTGNLDRSFEKKATSKKFKIKHSRYEVKNYKNIFDHQYHDNSHLNDYSQSYTPYTYIDYKNLVKRGFEVGKLGPNLGTEDWYRKVEKNRKMEEYNKMISRSNRLILSKDEIPMEEKKQFELLDKIARSKRIKAEAYGKNIKPPEIRVTPNGNDKYSFLLNYINNSNIRENSNNELGVIFNKSRNNKNPTDNYGESKTERLDTFGERQENYNDKAIEKSKEFNQKRSVTIKQNRESYIKKINELKNMLI